MICFNVEKLNNNNIINSHINTRYFKQININDKINLFNINIDKKYIKIHSASLNAESIKIINTIEGTSYEGQFLSGKKLLIIGSINIIFYIKLNCRTFQSTKKIPFSTFIVIPRDTNENSEIKLIYSIEDITIEYIECNFLFISVTIFLEYIKESSHNLLNN